METMSISSSMYHWIRIQANILGLKRCMTVPDTGTFLTVQFSRSVLSDSATPWTTAHQAFQSITNSWSLPKLMSIESVMPFNHLLLCHPLLVLPSIFPSIRLFSNESALHIRWPKCWSFSFNISSSNEHSGLISFRMDWLELLAVQETLKSLLQHHSSKQYLVSNSPYYMIMQQQKIGPERR